MPDHIPFAFTKKALPGEINDGIMADVTSKFKISGKTTTIPPDINTDKYFAIRYCDFFILV